MNLSSDISIDKVNTFLRGNGLVKVYSLNVQQFVKYVIKELRQKSGEDSIEILYNTLKLLLEGGIIQNESVIQNDELVTKIDKLHKQCNVARLSIQKSSVRLAPILPATDIVTPRPLEICAQMIYTHLSHEVRLLFEIRSMPYSKKGILNEISKKGIGNTKEMIAFVKNNLESPYEDFNTKLSSNIDKREELIALHAVMRIYKLPKNSKDILHDKKVEGLESLDKKPDFQIDTEDKKIIIEVVSAGKESQYDDFLNRKIKTLFDKISQDSERPEVFREKEGLNQLEICLESLFFNNRDINGPKHLEGTESKIMDIQVSRDLLSRLLHYLDNVEFDSVDITMQARYYLVQKVINNYQESLKKKKEVISEYLKKRCEDLGSESACLNSESIFSTDSSTEDKLKQLAKASERMQSLIVTVQNFRKDYLILKKSEYELSSLLIPDKEGNKSVEEKINNLKLYQNTYLLEHLRAKYFWFQPYVTYGNEAEKDILDNLISQIKKKIELYKTDNPSQDLKNFTRILFVSPANGAFSSDIADKADKYSKDLSNLLNEKLKGFENPFFEKIIILMKAATPLPSNKPYRSFWVYNYNEKEKSWCDADMVDYYEKYKNSCKHSVTPL